MRKNALINAALEELKKVQTEHPLISTGVLMAAGSLGGPIGRGLSTAVTAGNIANTLRDKQPISAAGQMAAATLPYTKLNPLLSMGAGMGAELGGNYLQNEYNKKYNADHAEPRFEHAASHGGIRMLRTKVAHPAAALIPLAGGLAKHVIAPAAISALTTGAGNLLSNQKFTEGMGPAALIGGASGAVSGGLGHLMRGGAAAPPMETTPKVAFYYNMKAAKQRIKYADETLPARIGSSDDELWNKALEAANEGTSIRNLGPYQAAGTLGGLAGGGLIGAGAGALSGDAGHGAGIGAGVGGGSILGASLGMHGAGGLAALLGGGQDTQLLAKSLGLAGGGLAGGVGGGMLGHHLTKSEEKRSMYHPNPVALAFMQRMNQVRLYKQAGGPVADFVRDNPSKMPPPEMLGEGLPHVDSSGQQILPGMENSEGIMGHLGKAKDDAVDWLGGDRKLQALGGRAGTHGLRALGAGGAGAVLGGLGGLALGDTGAGVGAGAGAGLGGGLGYGAGDILGALLHLKGVNMAPSTRSALRYGGGALGGVAGGGLGYMVGNKGHDKESSYHPRILLSGLTNAVRAGGQRMLPESFPTRTR